MNSGSSRRGAVDKESNCRCSDHCRGAGLIPGLAQWVKGYGIAALEAWFTGAAGIQSLARELPHAAGAGLKGNK